MNMDLDENQTNRKTMLDIINYLDFKNVDSKNNDNSYKNFYFQKFLMSHQITLWNKDIILSRLKTAFSKGFHGIHFIEAQYEPCIKEILNYYFNGKEHYLGYRVCETHHKIVLQPNYNKLGINPVQTLRPSFSIDVDIYIGEYKQGSSNTYADFCFE